MNITNVIEKVKSELPGYKIIGCFEKGFPQYKRRLMCLVLKDKKLPVVNEFVFRLFKLGMDLKDISLVLGLDYELVKDSWYTLIYLGLIKEETKQITDLGHNYLRENKIDSYEKLNLDVYIDGLTGKVTKDRSYTDSKSARSINLEVLGPLLPYPTENNIDKEQVKKIIELSQTKEPDEFGGSLIDILKIEGSNTHYKRMYIFICQNQDDIQFLVFDGLQRREEYEDKLKKLEENGIAISKPKMGSYFDGDEIKLINGYVHEKELYIDDLLGYYNNIQSARKEIVISIPLVSQYTPSDALIKMMEDKLKEGVKIDFLVSGQEFINPFQKEQYEKIIRLRNKYRHFILGHTQKYQNIFLMIDGANGFISSYKKHKLNFGTSEYSVTEFGYSLNEDQIKSILENLSIYFAKEKNISDCLNKDQLKKKVKNILQLITEFDDHVMNLNSIGWTAGEPIPNMQQLFEVPLCKTENQFKVFISTFYISLVESMNHAGKANGKNKYFWKEFKDDFPEIHNVLNKIRLYRHSTEHISLDEQNKPKYLKVLEEDLNGSLPIFVENGYHILQTKIIIELESVLRKQMEQLYGMKN